MSDPTTEHRERRRRLLEEKLAANRHRRRAERILSKLDDTLASLLQRSRVIVGRASTDLFRSWPWPGYSIAGMWIRDSPSQSISTRTTDHSSWQEIIERAPAFSFDDCDSLHVALDADRGGPIWAIAPGDLEWCCRRSLQAAADYETSALAIVDTELTKGVLVNAQRLYHGWIELTIWGFADIEP